MEKQEIVARLQENSSQMRSLGVQRLGIFGSYVRGEQTDASDVDLLVEFEAGKKTFDRFMRLAFYLEDLLEQPVELVTPESVSPYIRPYINSELQYVPLMD